jgi:hypothetical protein
MTKDEAISKLFAQCREDAGVVEVPLGSNRGPRVNQMLAYTGLGGGYFWCAAAVTAWGVEALGKLWPVPRSADCDTILGWARNEGVLHKSNPQPGDLFLCMRGSYDAFHIGVVTQVIDEDTIRAWEGNTNPGGSRNGYGVFLRRRSRHNLWYVRWVDALDTSDVATEPPKLQPQKPDWAVWVSPHGLFPRVVTHEGRPYAPVRALTAAILGISAEGTGEVVEWDETLRSAIVYGDHITPTILIDGVAWGPVREIAEALDCTISVKDNPATVGYDVTIGPSTKLAS